MPGSHANGPGIFLSNGRYATVNEYSLSVKCYALYISAHAFPPDMILL